MIDPEDKSAVIPSSKVRAGGAPVLVESGHGPEKGSRAMTVIPLAKDGSIQAFEVRCQCGSAVVVECVYDGGSAT